MCEEGLFPQSCLTECVMMLWPLAILTREAGCSLSVFLIHIVKWCWIFVKFSSHSYFPLHKCLVFAFCLHCVWCLRLFLPTFRIYLCIKCVSHLESELQVFYFPVYLLTWWHFAMEKLVSCLFVPKIYSFFWKAENTEREIFHPQVHSPSGCSRCI